MTDIKPTYPASPAHSGNFVFHRDGFAMGRGRSEKVVPGRAFSASCVDLPVRSVIAAPCMCDKISWNVRKSLGRYVRVSRNRCGFTSSKTAMHTSRTAFEVGHASQRRSMRRNEFGFGGRTKKRH
jgi:hypothetical protein